MEPDSIGIRKTPQEEAELIVHKTSAMVFEYRGRNFTVSSTGLSNEIMLAIAATFIQEDPDIREIDLTTIEVKRLLRTLPNFKGVYEKIKLERDANFSLTAGKTTHKKQDSDFIIPKAIAVLFHYRGSEFTVSSSGISDKTMMAVVANILHENHDVGGVKLYTKDIKQILTSLKLPFEEKKIKNATLLLNVVESSFGPAPPRAAHKRKAEFSPKRFEKMATRTRANATDVPPKPPPLPPLTPRQIERRNSLESEPLS